MDKRLDYKLTCSQHSLENLGSNLPFQFSKEFWL